MPYILNQDGTWEHTTEAAKKRLKYLEKAGYLHSDYTRFEAITDYKNAYYKNVINKLANKIIEIQEARERGIYKDLGIKGIKELNDIFANDEAMNLLIKNDIDNAYKVIADTLKKEFKDTKYMSKKVENINELVNKVGNTFEDTLNSMSKTYAKNLKKVDYDGTISKEEIMNNSTIKTAAQALSGTLRNFTNRSKSGEFKTAQEFASGAFRGLKGKMLEQCVAMFLAQLKNVKGVKVTGSNLDTFGKEIKADNTAITENYQIGLTVKNYATNTNSKGEISLKKEINLHSRGSFETFLKRLESFKNESLQSNLNTVAKRFRTDNYYYNLINEAANKTSFKSSNPAQDFINTVKDLAAGWFGSQLITDTKEQSGGQNVDFLVINNIGVIPMSSLLKALREESANINVNLTSKTNVDLEDLYEKKINSKHGKYTYSGEEVVLGAKAGKDVYGDIEVGAIRLHLILNKIIGEVNR